MATITIDTKPLSIQEHLSFVRKNIPKKKETELRLYLCGKMTGRKSFGFPEFRAVTKRLRDMGYDIVDPSEKEEMGRWLSRAHCMTADIDMLISPEWDMDGIVALPSAFYSEGACLEIEICRQTQKRHFYKIEYSNDGLVWDGKSAITIVPFVPHQMVCVRQWPLPYEDPD